MFYLAVFNGSSLHHYALVFRPTASTADGHGSQKNATTSRGLKVCSDASHQHLNIGIYAFEAFTLLIVLQGPKKKGGYFSDEDGSGDDS